MKKTNKFKLYVSRLVKFIILVASMSIFIRAILTATSNGSVYYNMNIVSVDAHVESHKIISSNHIYSVCLCNHPDSLLTSVESDDLYLNTYDHINDTVQVEFRYIQFLGITTCYEIIVTGDWIDDNIAIPYGRIRTNKKVL